MRPIRQTLSFLYDADGIAASQTSTATILINGVLAVGGVVTFTTPQYVSVNSAANLATIIFTFTGTDSAGNVITGTVTGVNNSTVTSTVAFKTITAGTVSATTGANTFIVGVLGSGVGKPIGMDYMLNPFQVGFALTGFSGTSATATVQYTFDDIQSSTFRENTAVWFDHPDVASETAAASGNFDKPVTAVRALMVSAAAAPGVTLQVVQSGTTSA